MSNYFLAAGAEALLEVLGPKKEENLPPPENKLTKTKINWARERKFITGKASRAGKQRLPPGQHLTKDWPVLDLGVTPNIPREDWQLEVCGVVENRIIWNFAQFSAQQQELLVNDIHCVTTWSRYDNQWEGLAARKIIDVCKPRPEARFVVLHSHDGYTTNLSMEDFSADGALLAHSWSGKPLEPGHGGPVRLVVPHLYFWKSAKWLKRIEFCKADARGYWEARGYHNRGDPWREQRYVSVCQRAWLFCVRVVSSVLKLQKKIIPELAILFSSLSNLGFDIGSVV